MTEPINLYSVDDIRSAVRLGNLKYDDAANALLRLGVQNPGRLLGHPVRVTPSPTLAARVDQFGRTFAGEQRRWS